MPALIGGWHSLVLLTLSLVSASRSWVVESHAAAAGAPEVVLAVQEDEVLLAVPLPGVAGSTY